MVLVLILLGFRSLVVVLFHFSFHFVSVFYVFGFCLSFPWAAVGLAGSARMGRGGMGVA